MTLATFDTEGSPGGTSSGNRLTLQPDAARLLALLLKRIRRAVERVWIELYILEPDTVGMLVVDELVAAAKRGCNVVLLLDGWGARKFNRRHQRRIEEAGGTVAYYNPIVPWRRPGRKLAPILHRDHRKIVLVDNFGFVGGRNISKDYLGSHPFFVDMTVQVEGPAVYDIATVFVEAAQQAAGLELELPSRTEVISGGVDVSVVELDQRLGYPDLDKTILNALDRVSRKCSIITPYFVPPDWFLEALVRALERKVAVRILTAGKSDVPLAKSAGRHLYADLVELGASIYEMQGHVLHTKAITFDDEICIIGSYNVDAYGSRHNLEVGIATLSPSLVATLEARIDARIAGTRPIESAEWNRRGNWARFVESLSYRLYRI